MNWPAIVIILLFVIFAIPYLRMENCSLFFAETWFGFLLILGGVGFLRDSFKFDHIMLSHGGHFGGAILDRWQMRLVGLLSLSFGVRWIYGPIRRRLKKKDGSDDHDAT